MTKQELVRCIDAYGKDIYSFCRHLTRDYLEADELYQDVWLKVMERLDFVEADERVKSFCLSVAVGLWRNRKRKFAWRGRIAPMQSYETADGAEYVALASPSPEEQACEKEMSRSVWAAVEELPEKFKIVVLLYYMEELPLEQISRIVCIPKGTVKSRLYQARKILEKKLEGFLK